MTVLRQILLIAIAALVSWFLFLRSPDGMEIADGTETNALPAPELNLAVRPRIEEAPQSPVPQDLESEQETESQHAPEDEIQPAPPDAESEVASAAPPAPELGVPEGTEDGEIPPPATAQEELVAQDPPTGLIAQPSSESTDTQGFEAVPQGSPRSRFLEDEALLASAQRELSGEMRVGFETRILSAPEDQLEISRSFGGQIVLVPRSAIDPTKDASQAVWFRLKPDAAGTAARVERVVGPPELANWTRYRDLFDYEYARLPKEVRDLRRSVLSRAEVFLFAGLISAREWALVVGRRTEALNRAGRRPEELRRATLRTIRTKEGFDFSVESLEYTQDAQN